MSFSSLLETIQGLHKDLEELEGIIAELAEQEEAEAGLRRN